ncbi:MAG: crossover junction endodeoxyribonuclease RuvC [bacterium]|jgi:crossover junction endodeoxyribonuclease RuvC
MRVLGIDTSLRSTGVGVIESLAGKTVAIECGRIHNSDRICLSECLRRIDVGIRDLIHRTKPDLASIEDIFFAKNAHTSMVLGEARGVVIAACATSGIPVYQYEPRRVKQSITGSGAAEKAQVRKMVMVLLGLKEEPQEDAGDALAIALCHLNSRSPVAELNPKPI